MTARPVTVMIIIAVALAAVAFASPTPERVTDRDVYEATAAQHIVPDCTDLHCFRVLVAWVVGSVPGPSLVKWKLYAVTANIAAAAAVLALSLRWGLTARAAVIAAILSAAGFGSLYTLHDVFTSDPLMYALGPVVVLLLLQERIAIAAGVAAVGVMAKEFIAAPLFIVSAIMWRQGRIDVAARTFAAALAVFIVWLTLQLILIIKFNYGYGDNPSTQLLAGGYLAHWVQEQTWRGVASALFNEFGALWLLAPAGFLLAPPEIRQFALYSLPVALVFAYVQQPDRALWNFHFVVAPLAAIVLDRVNVVLGGAIVGLFIIANLRVGAQLPYVPAARYALALSTVCAAIAVITLFMRSPKPQFA